MGSKTSVTDHADTRSLMTDITFEELRPEQISGLLGRWAQEDPDSKAFILRRIKPRTRFILIGVAAMLLLLVVAFFDHALIAPAGTRTAISLIINPVPKPTRVSLPLLQDPVGLVAVVMTLLAPVLFAVQVSAIREFNSTNKRNIAYRVRDLAPARDKIDREIELANDRFSRIGRRDVSAVILLLSAAASAVIDYLFRKWGLFLDWNKTDLSGSTWKSRVYAGWWANPDSHLVLAIALWALGCYFFYFIMKQIWMGAVFAIYINKVTKCKFGVSPTMTANTDGFWGLSPVRRFMLATYSSALGHTVMVVGILVIWLPFNAFTIVMVTAVTIINSTEVIYPTIVGHVGAHEEKRLFVQHILDNAKCPTPTKDEVAQIGEVWARPVLPIRVRSTLTTVTVSLLFPFFLAVVSRLLGG